MHKSSSTKLEGSREKPKSEVYEKERPWKEEVSGLTYIIHCQKKDLFMVQQYSTSHLLHAWTEMLYSAY